jgi:Tfp pilus assembly protein PilN
VPILGLWRPKQITNDLWRVSRRDYRASLTLLNWWWGLYLAAGWVFAVGWVLSRAFSNTQTAAQVLTTQRAGYWISIVGCALYAAAGVLTAIMAWRISQPED